MKSTRRDAMQAVERFYQTGFACKRGHTGPRYTASGCCAECLGEWREIDKEDRRTFARLLREKEATL